MTELVANVVRHTRCHRLTLDVERRGEGTVRIGVADESHALPEERASCEDDVTGRGLRIIGELSHAWGCEKHHWGKIVWADLVASPTTEREC
ncbi:ATP-binding protein [Streptomyces sp. SID5473]|uniref:ATP-binding protein n=1 Tax=Streptomyces tsukubensis (strain DSM 42081 / NBRC 108919 / NRRL 18488 / 9993) TaxID=1114943 RepID=I2N4V4_STRT9|nr:MULTISPECIES: ATP-binding protein [Streptomyces]AZK96084.1 ATP-binding protein [Streptomyces tsukubensis]EIF92051.1 regulatory protein [Streptomyces tsukubensis NRRL18488]MYS63778.1 ATP-binding protein [Streptomyces sp. SID5473]QKM67898.1 ATP-binding protein [Streptomyces tsukubensis NRRL18488]TAI44292.1 ATP-binding protein [Streptomyces tsukubensis]